ncbi:MAG: hypothetical protein MJ126_05210 [Lachnospiraceae bacterium]|nr:hypothetical protein [Lachnospiraceae bacterium]
MALDENSLNDEIANDNEVEKLMAELKLAEDMDLQDILAGEGEAPEEAFLDAIPDDNFENQMPDFDEVEEEEILQEELIDMDEIDAILSDVSDVHPERTVSAKELQDRIDKYAENPEEAERLLNADEADTKEAETNDTTKEETVANESETQEAAKEDSVSEATEAGLSEMDEAISGLDSISTSDDDFLANLENVDELLADVEKQAKEESVATLNEPDYSQDSDLAEINELINKSENNEAINDELLSMLDGVDDNLGPMDIEDLDNPAKEGEAEETAKGKKKKEKKKKKKKDKAEGADASQGQEEPKEKKGLFAKIFGFITEDDESDEEAPKEEAEESKGKKDKKKKNDKKAKGKAKDNASIEAELDEEDKKSNKKDKKKKEKKPKKAPKAKEVKDEPQEKSNIKKGGIIFTAAFCLTLLGLIMVLCVGGTRLLAKNEARIAYYKGDYETASNKLYGMRLSKSDELIFKKASLMYRITLLKDKIEAYELMGDERKICDAMFELRKECDNLYVDAKLLNITNELGVEKEEIDEKISLKYGIEKEDIEAICKAKKVYYTVAVDNLISGQKYYIGAEKYFESVTGVSDNQNGNDESSEEVTDDTIEDLLPEEAEINN